MQRAGKKSSLQLICLSHLSTSHQCNQQKGCKDLGVHGVCLAALTVCCKPLPQIDCKFVDVNNGTEDGAGVIPMAGTCLHLALDYPRKQHFSQV